MLLLWLLLLVLVVYVVDRGLLVYVPTLAHPLTHCTTVVCVRRFYADFKDKVQAAMDAATAKAAEREEQKERDAAAEVAAEEQKEGDDAAEAAEQTAKSTAEEEQ